MTWTHSAPTKLKTLTETIDLNDFFIEAGLGNVPGNVVEFILGLNRDVGSTLEDVWGAGVDIVFPTVGEQWEIASTDVNDTFGGTGANLVGVSYLDTDYVVQFEVVVMNGTTPVSMVATNAFRPNRLLVVAGGSNGSNVGDVTARVAGVGAFRNFMFAEFSISMDGHFTVPAGDTGLILFCQVNAGRNDGVEFRIRRSIGATGVFGVSLFNNIFENIANTTLPLGVRLTERTDVIFSALNTGVGNDADCFAICEVLLVANDS